MHKRASYEAVRQHGIPGASFADESTGLEWDAWNQGQWLVLTRKNIPLWDTGWKLHISVSKRDIPKAWNVVADCLLRHGIAKAKVQSPEFGQSSEDALRETQERKAIVIYDCRQQVAWADFIREIEDALRKNRIGGGSEIRDEKAIPGSKYIYYRNSKKPNGRTALF